MSGTESQDFDRMAEGQQVLQEARRDRDEIKRLGHERAECQLVMDCQEAEIERLRALVKAAYDEGTSHGESNACAYEWGGRGDEYKSWKHSEAKAALDPKINQAAGG